MMPGRRSDFRRQARHGLTGRDALGFRGEVGDHAVHQHRFHNGVYVFPADDVAALESGAGLGPKNQELDGAGACAPGYILLYPFRGSFQGGRVARTSFTAYS